MDHTILNEAFDSAEGNLKVGPRAVGAEKHLTVWRWRWQVPNSYCCNRWDAFTKLWAWVETVIFRVAHSCVNNACKIPTKTRKFWRNWQLYRMIMVVYWWRIMFSLDRHLTECIMQSFCSNNWHNLYATRSLSCGSSVDSWQRDAA